MFRIWAINCPKFVPIYRKMPCSIQDLNPGYKKIVKTRLPTLGKVPFLYEWTGQNSGLNECLNSKHKLII